MEPNARWLPPSAVTPAPVATAGEPVETGLVAPPAGAPFGEPRRPLLKRIGGGLAVVGATIAKFLAQAKALIFLLPKLKLLTFAVSAAVSVAAYALLWGWSFAVGFVVLLFVHEMGHVIALRREGIKATAPLFIPFLGAVIKADLWSGDALREARVGLAGPILGTLGAALCVPLYLVTGSQVFLALAYVGFLLNLFNLLPVVPLDGGRAMAAMSPWMWFLGFGVLVALVLLVPSPVLLIIVLLAGFETYRRWKLRKSGSLQQAAYYRVAPRHRLAVACVYIGLIVLLALGMHEAHILSSGGHSFTSI